MRVRLGFLLLLAGIIAATPALVNAETPEAYLAKQVRHELAMLPYYTVFDHLQFQVDGNTVILSGEVSRPVLKRDAEGVVKRIEGIGGIVNRIEVLPLSPFDDRIRGNVLRAIYTKSNLQRYALGARPSIHVIVKNGTVTLEGVVANEMDRTVANLQANMVSGVFSVTNNLRIEGERRTV